MVSPNDVFLALCEMTAAISPYPNIFSIPCIARKMETTQYAVRKQIKVLEADGLIAKACEGGVDEDGCVHCVHGWSLTSKGRESECFKKCEKAAIEEMDRFLKESHEEWLQEEAAKIGNR